jgi:hypothetical protein
MHMRKIAILCLSSLLLASCVGIDSRMTIRDNGSGTLILTYRVSQLAADLGTSSTGKSAIPLPISRQDFDRSIAAANGKVRLIRFSRTENEKDITISAELSFDSIEALASLDAFKDAQLKATTDGARNTMSQVIAKTPPEPLTDDTKRMIDSLFSGYDISFTVETPRPIQSSTLGTVSADKRTLTYKASVRDVMTTAGDLVLEMSW